MRPRASRSVCAAPAWAAAPPSPGVTHCGAAPAAQSLQLVLPLKADLSRAASASPRRRSRLRLAAVRRSTSRSRSSHIGSAPRPFARTRVRRTFAARGLEREDRRHRAVRRRDDGRGSRRAAVHDPLAQFRSDRGVRFVAPAAAAAPAGHLPPDAGPGHGRGRTRHQTRFPPRRRCAQLSRPRSAVAHAASQPSSARLRTGTPRGCAPGVALRGFTPNQYLTAYGYAPLHAAGFTGQGERVALIEIDGFQLPATSGLRAVLQPADPGLERVRGRHAKHPLPPGGEATLDLEVLDAAAPEAQGGRRLRVGSRAADTLRGLTAPLRASRPRR